MRLHLAALVELVGSASGLIFVLVVTQAELGFSALVATTVLAACISTLIAFVLAARLVRLRVRFGGQEVRRLLAASLPVALFALLGILHFRIDTVLLSLLGSLDDVGTYSAAYRFPEQVLFIPGLFIAATYPLLAGYAARDDPQIGATVSRSLAFLLPIAFPLTAATAVLAPDLIELVAGSGFDDAAGPLRVLAFAAVFMFANTLFSSLLIVYHEQRRLAWLIAVALLGNIAVNLVLIPLFGPMGAAAATLGMAVVLAATEAAPLAVTAAAGVVAYGGLAYALGVVRRSDLALLLVRRPRAAG
jgi:O-antigen/teichoic acid export membrane protein